MMLMMIVINPHEGTDSAPPPPPVDSLRYNFRWHAAEQQNFVTFPKINGESILNKNSRYESLGMTIMSQLISTGYISPGNPREIFFERANPGQFFGLIPCPWAKMMVEFPGVGQIFPNLKRLLLKLTKNQKKRKLRDSTNFIWRT